MVIFSITTNAQVFTVYPGERGYLAVDSANNIWAESSGTMRKFDGNSWSTISHSCIKPYTGIVLEFTIDKNSNIWTASGQYIYKYNIFSGDCKTYYWDIYDSIMTYTLKKMIVDKFGDLWFSMEYQATYPGTTICKIENDSVIAKTGGWPASFWNMVADNFGNIWFGTNDVYNSVSTLYEYTLTDSLKVMSNDCYYPRAVDTSNHIWTGSYEFDGTTCINHKVTGACLNDLGSFTINALIIDQNNIKWYGTSIGLVRYDGVNCTLYDTINSDIPQLYVSKLLIDKQNNIWFNSSKSSIGEYNIVKACGLIDTCITVVSEKLKVESEKLKVYPNPSGNKIKISVPNHTKETGVSIYNISGSEVFKEQFKSSEIEINTESFQKGVYLIKVSYGNEVFNEKVVVN